MWRFFLFTPDRYCVVVQTAEENHKYSEKWQPGMKCLGYETTFAKQPYLIDYQLFMSQSREGAK